MSWLVWVDWFGWIKGCCGSHCSAQRKRAQHQTNKRTVCERCLLLLPWAAVQQFQQSFFDWWGWWMERRRREQTERRPKRSAVREQTTQLFFSWLCVGSQRKERVGLLFSLFVLLNYSFFSSQRVVCWSEFGLLCFVYGLWAQRANASQQTHSPSLSLKRKTRIIKREKRRKEWKE